MEPAVGKPRNRSRRWIWVGAAALVLTGAAVALFIILGTPQVSEQARAAAAALQEDHTDPAALFPDNYFAGSDLDASDIFEGAPVFEPDVKTWQPDGLFGGTMEAVLRDGNSTTHVRVHLGDLDGRFVVLSIEEIVK